MSSRTDAKREWKERVPDAGIFVIRNAVNGKVYLGSSKNLHGPLNKHRFMLSTGMHDNAAMQADWKAHGPAAFTFEIVEVVKRSDAPGFSLDDELALLEQIWIEKLEPFGDRGYNVRPSIREA